MKNLLFAVVLLAAVAVYCSEAAKLHHRCRTDFDCDNGDRSMYCDTDFGRCDCRQGWSRAFPTCQRNRHHLEEWEPEEVEEGQQELVVREDVTEKQEPAKKEEQEEDHPNLWDFCKTDADCETADGSMMCRSHKRSRVKFCLCREGWEKTYRKPPSDNFYCRPVTKGQDAATTTSQKPTSRPVTTTATMRTTTMSRKTRPTTVELSTRPAEATTRPRTSRPPRPSTTTRRPPPPPSTTSRRPYPHPTSTMQPSHHAKLWKRCRRDNDCKTHDNSMVCGKLHSLSNSKVCVCRGDFEVSASQFPNQDSYICQRSGHDNAHHHRDNEIAAITDEENMQVREDEPVEAMVEEKQLWDNCKTNADCQTTQDSMRCSRRIGYRKKICICRENWEEAFSSSPSKGYCRREVEDEQDASVEKLLKEEQYEMQVENDLM